MDPDDSHSGDTLLLGLRRALAASNNLRSVAAAAPENRRSGITPERLADIVACILAAPSINTATPPGVTKGRLAALLAPGEREFAQSLMLRFDQACVLTEPRAESLRWREPRRFITGDIDWILAQIAARAEEE